MSAREVPVVSGTSPVPQGGQSKSNLTQDAAESPNPQGTTTSPDEAAGNSLRGIVWLLAALAAVDVAMTIWWLLFPGPGGPLDRITCAAALPAGLIVLAIVLRVRRTETNSAMARAWAIALLAIIVYGTGSALDLAAGIVPSLHGLEYAGKVLQIIAYFVAGGAVIVVRRPGETRVETLVSLIDAAIVASSVAILVWHLVFFTEAREAGHGWVMTAFVTCFPTADITLAFGVALALARIARHPSQTAILLGAAALTLVFLADIESGRNLIHGVHSTGGLAGLLYSFGWLVMAAALVLLGRGPSDESQAWLTGRFSRVGWTSYGLVGVAFVGPVLWDWNDIEALHLHMPATGLLIVLLIIRLELTSRRAANLAAVERLPLAAAVEQAAEAILITDPAGIVSYVNPAFSRITGFAPDEIVGRDPSLLRAERDPERLTQMREALARGETWVGRLSERRKDGTTVEFDMAVAPLRDSSSMVVGAVEVARDLSRERALEAQLAQAQRLEAVGRLAGGVAHDFNNILTAISGFGQLAAESLDADHSASSDIHEVLKAADRAAALTRALLAFSRRQVLQPKQLDLNEVVANVRPILDRLIGENIRLTVRLDREIGLTLADPGQMEQVIMNLVVNARDAMPEGGSLTITTGNEEVGSAYVQTHLAARPGSFVALTVTDTGVGMSPEVLEHAFEPFFTTKPRGKGTGLGLSTVIGIVEQSGGFIVADSTVGVGSIFRVCLPRVEAEPAIEEDVVAVAPTLRGTETILVAEDEPAVRVLVERVLTEAGYQVYATPNGQAAIAMARMLPCLDLLFTDVVMPGISGIELSRILAVDRPELAVIFASGYSDEALVRDDDGGGGMPYLSKPFTSEALLTRVREALDRRPMTPGEGGKKAGSAGVEGGVRLKKARRPRIASTRPEG